MFGTFERFWAAVGRDRWSHFTSLASVLRYLKMCTHSLVLDANRARVRAHSVSLDDLADEQLQGIAANTVEETLLGDVAALELWQTIADILTDEDERLVAYLSLVRGLQPRAIAARQRQRLATTADVYRVKRNALERLRRNPRLQAYVHERQALPL